MNYFIRSMILPEVSEGKNHILIKMDKSKRVKVHAWDVEKLRYFILWINQSTAYSDFFFFFNKNKSKMSIAEAVTQMLYILSPKEKYIILCFQLRSCNFLVLWCTFLNICFTCVKLPLCYLKMFIHYHDFKYHSVSSLPWQKISFKFSLLLGSIWQVIFWQLQLLEKNRKCYQKW